MSKIRKTILSVSLGIMISAPQIYAESPAAPSQVTQAELAQILVNLMGLSPLLPSPATAQEMFALLLANGCTPVDGWHAEKVVTKADLARVVVQAMGMTEEVENPDDPNSWVRCLKENGIAIDTIGEAVQNVNPPAEPVASFLLNAGISTDPLVKQQVFGLPDEQQFGADLEISPNPSLATDVPTPAPTPTPTRRQIEEMMAGVPTAPPPGSPMTPDGGEVNN